MLGELSTSSLIEYLNPCLMFVFNALDNLYYKGVVNRDRISMNEFLLLCTSFRCDQSADRPISLRSLSYVVPKRIR
jgi:hypothetical protein